MFILFEDGVGIRNDDLAFFPYSGYDELTFCCLPDLLYALAEYCGVTYLIFSYIGIVCRFV